MVSLDDIYSIKTYSFNKESFNRMKYDIKVEKVGRVVSFGIYSTLFILYLRGYISNKDLLTWIGCILTSIVVKYIYRTKRFK